MFDIGFTEMMIIAVVALVVLGPERLPKVAKQAGEWMGKLRRYVDDVKSDINRQMELDELRKLKSQVQDAAQSLRSSVEGVVNDTKNELSELNSAFAGTLTAPPGSDAPTDWDRIYAVRRARERIKDRRIERSKELGMKRPKRAYPRFTRPVFEDEPVVPVGSTSAIAAASPSIGSVMSVDCAIAAAVPSHDAELASTAGGASAGGALAKAPAAALTQATTS